MVNARRWVRWLVACVLACGCSGALWAQEPVRITQAEFMHADGIGYSLPPYSLDSHSLSGPWETVTLPHAVKPSRVDDALRDKTSAPPTVQEWYRVHIPPTDWAASAGSRQAHSNPLALYLPRWKADGTLAIYGNGRLLYQSHAGMAWNGWNIPLRIALDETADAPPPSELVFRLERPRFTGGGISSVWVGPEQALDVRYRLRQLIQLDIPALSSASFLAVGVFALLVWLRERREPLYPLFFWVSVASYLRTLHFHVGAERLPMPEVWFSWLTLNSLFWMVSLVHFFLNMLHGHPSRWLAWVMVLVPVLVGVCTLPVSWAPFDAYTVAALAYVALLVYGSLAAVLDLRKSRQHHSRDGMLLASWGGVGMGLGIYDWFLQNNLIDIEGIYLGPYTNVLAFLMLAYIMYRRYVDAVRVAQQAQVNLTQRLAEREAELLQSHERLREIEQRELLTRERTRLMQDMHDGMGSSLRSALWAVEHGQQTEAMLADILKNCIDDLKLAIDSMEPVQTDLLLLLATWRFRLEPRLHNTGIRLCWAVTDIPPIPWLEPHSALHILRILQEALTNIMKHAHATEVRVATGVEGEGVWLSIQDNGVGLAATSVPPETPQLALPPGRGLNNMRQRAQAIQASLTLCPAQHCPPHGTLLRLWLPLTQQNPTARRP
jgi:signal transduction histidine kinase